MGSEAVPVVMEILEVLLVMAAAAVAAAAPLGENLLTAEAEVVATTPPLRGNRAEPAFMVAQAVRVLVTSVVLMALHPLVLEEELKQARNLARAQEAN